jgi:uncharacterized protein (TIGR02145 family)
MALTQSFAQEKGSFTDPRDKKTYKIVKIGAQTWMAENLDYHGENGFLGLCYGDNPKEKIRQPENCKKYGRLYNWNEAMKACPAGWHLPIKEEWQKLSDFAGGDSVAGEKLKAKSGWNIYKARKCKLIEEKTFECERTVTEYDKYTTDEYGFSALPGGIGNSGGALYYDVGNSGRWWSASEDDSNFAYNRHIYYGSEYAYWYYSAEYILFSVRCVQGE